ncbi:MAG: hypothetical protein KJ607_01465 [Bacteroidetes bacterium]|nr:hypothetical protein [Bacteroidota bacterium]
MNGIPDFKAMLVDSSRAIGDMVAERVGDNPGYYAEILRLAFSPDPQIAARAGRVAILCAEKSPELLRPHLKNIIKQLPQMKTPGTSRCLLNLILNGPEIEDEGLLGSLVNICFENIMSGKETAAVKVYSTEILYSISCREPGIKYELIAVIEDQLEKNTPAFKNVGQKLLSKLYKETG